MITRKKFIELNSKLAISSFVLSQVHFDLLASSPNQVKHQESFNGAPIDFNFFDALKSYRIVQNYDSSNLLILAYEVNDDLIKALPSNRNISIFCYKATISSPITLNGRNLFLLACNLTCNNGSINLTGANGLPCNPVQKSTPGGKNNVRNATNPDLNGSNQFIDQNGNAVQGDASPGGPMNGASGGNLTLNIFNFTGNLNIISRGGNGGTGQQGANGRNGADYNTGDINAVRNAPGGIIPGFPAENGGIGAPGGFGGNGGNVTICCKNADAAKKIISTTVVTGGSEGDGGKGGSPGQLGGRGVRFAVLPPELSVLRGGPYAPLPAIVPYPNTGAGQPGGQYQNLHDRDGRAGVIYNPETRFFFNYIPYDFAKLLMLKAESLYLNASFTKGDANLNDAYNILQFLLEISSNNPGTGFTDTSVANQQFLNQSLFYLNGLYSTNNQWSLMQQKCHGYISQIILNRDIYGNPPNYAPVLNSNFLIANYIQALPLIAGFREFANTLTQDQINLQVDQFKNNVNIGQCQNNIDQLTQTNDSLSKKIQSLNLELQQRFVVIENMKDELVKDQSDFDNAIRNDGECGLIGIFHCITAVISIASAIYTCGATTVAAVKSLGAVADGLAGADSLGDLKKLVTDSNSIVRKGIADISKDVGTVEDNITKISTIYNTQLKNGPNVPDSLIGVDSAKFDAVIDKYTDKYPEAQKYKDDYHRFIDYVNITGQKRIEITSCVMQINQNYQNIALSQSQKNDLQLANTMDQTSKLSLTNKVSLFDLYYATRGYAINLIYLQNKALNYQLPGQRLGDSAYNDDSIETLNTDVYRNNWQQVLSLNARDFNRISNTQPLNIRFSDYGISYKNFTTQLTDGNGLQYFSFEFTIPASKPDLGAVFQGNKKNIKIMGIQAILNSSKNYNRSITFRVTHLGNSTVTLDADFKNEMQFIHESRTANLTSYLKKGSQQPISFDSKLPDGSDPQANLVGENFVSKDNIALGVSPFASWKIEFYPFDNANLSANNIRNIIKNLDSMDLYFWYYFQFAV